MSYSLNYISSWVSTEGLNKSINIYKKNYTGEVIELDLTNVQLKYSKNDAKIDQTIKGKRLTCTVLTKSNELRAFRNATRDEFIIIFTVDGKDRFSGFYENTGYFEQYSNDKYELDLFFIDGFTFGKSLFYTAGTGDKLLQTLLNDIFTEIDPQAILKASSSVEINENNNFYITIDSTDYRFNFRNIEVRDLFFDGKSYYQIIEEVFSSILASVYYVDNTLYSFNLLNSEDRLKFNKYSLTGLTETDFTIETVNYENNEFIDSYVVELNESYSIVDLTLPYESDSILLGNAYDLSESNFVATGTNSPDGNNYDIWDVNFLNNPDDTNIRVYKTTDLGLDVGDSELQGGFVFVDSYTASTGGLTDRITVAISGGNQRNGSFAAFIPDLPSGSTTEAVQYYLFYDEFDIRKGSYLPASYTSNLNNFKISVKVDFLIYTEDQESENKLEISCMPEIVLGSGNLYLVNISGVPTWQTKAQIDSLIISGGGIVKLSPLGIYSEDTNEPQSEYLNFRFDDLNSFGERGFFTIPDSVISENSLTPENITLRLNFGMNTLGADSNFRYVQIKEIKAYLEDMELEGSYIKSVEDTTKQGQPYSKEIAIHTEGGFRNDKDLDSQDILAFNIQEYQRLNMPYTTLTVSGNTRRFPFANNDTTGDFQNLETNVSNKVLNLSGKEKITFTRKGYLKENTVFTYEGNYYIISSQSINESDDVNQVQLIRIDE